MSRFYNMTVTISRQDSARLDAIKTSAKAEWPFDDWSDNGGDGNDSPTASAEGFLSGGESEEQFIERLSVAVWKANGAYCDVIVDATFLESLPYETHHLDEADYQRLIKGTPMAKKES
jgi:hypothetical protein